MTRRIAAVAFSMLLMLSLAPREGECREHRSHEAETVALAEGTTHSAHHDGAAADTTTPCESTDNSDCCQAVESCSTTHAIRSTHALAPPVLADHAVSHFGARAPAYLIRPPEPPPPKK